MTTKNRVYIAIIIFLSLGFLLLIFLIQPAYQDIKDSAQELIFIKEELASLERKIKNIEEFRENYQEINENLEKMEKLFVQSKVPIGFISFLERRSQESRCQIEISPSAIAQDKDSPWPYLTFHIESVSSAPNFFRFLEKLEVSPYLVEIRNLTIRRLTEKDLRLKQYEGASIGDVEATIVFKAFAQ